MSKPRSRTDREGKTLQAMIRLYCHGRHHSRGRLCADCQAIEAYALQRLSRCPYQAGKTTCARCPTHCYRPAMRQRIRGVMRYAGPRMIYRHPILALRHMVDGLRAAPTTAKSTAPTAEEKRDA